MAKPLAVGFSIYAGHFTQGVIDAGYEVLAILEEGKFGTATHRQNYPYIAVHQDPARWPLAQLTEAKVDLLYSNAPCSGLSFCFVAGTPVMTLGGLRPIEQVQPGDVVLTYHAGRFQVVRKVFRRQRQGEPLVTISADGGQAVTCTPEHLVCTNYTGEPARWTAAGDCHKMRGWFPADRCYRELRVTPAAGSGTWLYDLEVDGDSCYTVGGLLVHNCNSWRSVDNQTNGGLHRATELGLTLRPRAFIVESVANLFRQGAPLVEGWERRWQAAGYKTCRLSENAEHLGLPQVRRRALFIAARANLDFHYERAPRDHVADPVTVHEAIGDLLTQPLADDPHTQVPYTTAPQNDYQRWCRRDQDRVAWHAVGSVTRAVQTLVPHIPPGGRVDNVPEDVYEETYYKARKPSAVRPDRRGKPCFLFRRLRWDIPSVTLTGGPYLFHPEFDRLLTVREQARLMGIPDSFTFAGGSRNVPYGEIGKAVSPLVGAWVVRQVSRCLADPGGREHRPVVDLMQEARKNPVLR
jgi:site-specific DNA-cytosine methylase